MVSMSGATSPGLSGGSSERNLELKSKGVVILSWRECRDAVSAVEAGLDENYDKCECMTFYYGDVVRVCMGSS
jgi:hypothetical protein